VVELFTYCKMGGDPEHIELLLLSEAEAMQRDFSSFATKRTSCFLSEDRQPVRGCMPPRSACGRTWVGGIPHAALLRQHHW
jgi:hypothetical protein